MLFVWKTFLHRSRQASSAGSRTSRREKRAGSQKSKSPGGPSLTCSIEILKLADGQDGLIVAETDADERLVKPVPCAPTQAAKRAVRKTSAGTAKQRRKAPKSTPTLTTEEMRAFKAVGRKVLRLCEEKKDLPPSTEAPLPVAAPSPFGSAGPSPDRSAQALADVLAAFDLVFFLSDSLDIVGLQGRAPRLGWRKVKLVRKNAYDLLLPYDQGILRRMFKRLNRGASKRSRDTLVVRGETGDGVACRAVLGRWGEGGAEFFLALLSLELPARLKRLQPVNAVAASRLAA